MFINPFILKTATFLIVDDKPCSTVFFVLWNLGDGVSARYAVTTRHSIDSPIVGIRFNLMGGGTEPQYFAAEEWIKHPSTDVAVLPLELPLNRYDIDYVRLHFFASRENLLVWPEPGERPYGADWPYGTGDEVFTVGLFEGHTGQRLAQPVARFGHIALKPSAGEKILAEIDPPDLTPINALLVEMAVWNGQSGSPVFLRVPMTTPSRMLDNLESYHLIGMVQGFYPGEQDVRINSQAATLSPLQMGIGIVIPAEDIREALWQEPLKEQREKLKRKN